MKTENILWMGDIEPWMNELVIKKSFIENGFEPKNIKFIKDKKYNIFQNYCFIYFDNILDASNALCTLNGKKILNSNVNFKLNWANKNSENYKNVYVGNLPTKVTDVELYNFFKSKYPSVHHASIVRENGISKKFGFINFIDDEEYQKCLKEMDGAVFHNNIIRVQKIIDEFRATLNRKYPVAEEFDKIYRYLLRRLLEANATKDEEIMKEVVEHLRSMRDNWKEVMKKVKEEREGAV